MRIGQAVFRLFEASSIQKKQHFSSTRHKDASMTYRPLFIQNLIIIWFGGFPSSLRSKTCKTDGNTSASYFDTFPLIDRDGRLHTSLNRDCSYHKISVSKQQYAMVARLWRFYLTSFTRLVPLMSVLFCGPSKFPISFLSGDIQRNA